MLLHPMKSKFVSILILLLSGLCVASARSKAPNILLMVADDLGFSDLDRKSVV